MASTTGPAAMPTGTSGPDTSASASAHSVSARAGPSHTAATNPQPPEVDKDGFQTVRRRGWKKDGAGRTGGGDGANGAGRVEAEGGTTARTDDQGYEDDEAAGEDPGTAPSPSDLRQAWQRELALVKRLRQQGVEDGHPAMLAAGQARDAAERRWREAKDPTPPTLRLSRAQTKLDRAIHLQAESRMALTEHERAFRERQAELQARLEEDTARVRARRLQLEEVQEEIAMEGRGGKARAAQGTAVRQVHGTLCNEVAPSIAALVEQLDSSTPAWAILNNLLASLTTSKSLLEQAMPAQGTQAFDIADEGDDHAVDEDYDGQGRWDGSEWSESHDVMGADDGAGDRGGDNADATDDGMDVGDGDGGWWGGAQDHWQRTARWAPSGYGKWARTSWADSWESEQHGGRGACDDDHDQPPPARRRLGDRSDAAAGSVAAAPATTGGPSDGDLRAKAHRERVELITQRAIDAGIQPLTSQGEDLCVLDSNALDAWVAERFPEQAQG